MNKLTALLSFMLSLLGIDLGGSSYVHRSHADGADTLYSKAHVQAGVARFECMHSASGRCHYTVLAHDCAPASASSGQRADDCLSTPLERFTLASGDSRQIAGLNEFRLCVSSDAMAPGPDCAMPRPLAAR